jgi:hypothetical protein
MTGYKMKIRIGERWGVLLAGTPTRVVVAPHLKKSVKKG